LVDNSNNYLLHDSVQITTLNKISTIKVGNTPATKVIGRNLQSVPTDSTNSDINSVFICEKI